MSWFKDHAVLFALICAGVAIAYGLYLTLWLLRQPDGNDMTTLTLEAKLLPPSIPSPVAYKLRASVWREGEEMPTTHARIEHT